MSDGGDFDVEFRGDGADAEDNDEKIEGVESPAEEGGEERVALGGSEAAEWAKELDVIFSRRIGR